uniref:Uncharacterized protein n=1 Tax=Oryza sativa subsp. japonica TaxID=39947 RepID=Q6ERD7_ORYSJ|nr:hypothetical protein [Oryza sativa Japonica Group]
MACTNRFSFDPTTPKIQTPGIASTGAAERRRGGTQADLASSTATLPIDPPADRPPLRGRDTRNQHGALPALRTWNRRGMVVGEEKTNRQTQQDETGAGAARSSAGSRSSRPPPPLPAAREERGRVCLCFRTPKTITATKNQITGQGATWVATTTAFLPPPPRHRPSRPPETARLRGRRRQGLPSPSRAQVGAHNPDQLGVATVRQHRRRRRGRQRRGVGLGARRRPGGKGDGRRRERWSSGNDSPSRRLSRSRLGAWLAPGRRGDRQAGAASRWAGVGSGGSLPSWSRRHRRPLSSVLASVMLRRRALASHQPRTWLDLAVRGQIRRLHTGWQLVGGAAACGLQQARRRLAGGQLLLGMGLLLPLVDLVVVDGRRCVDVELVG